MGQCASASNVLPVVLPPARRLERLERTALAFLFWAPSPSPPSCPPREKITMNITSRTCKNRRAPISTPLLLVTRTAYNCIPELTTGKNVHGQLCVLIASRGVSQASNFALTKHFALYFASRLPWFSFRLFVHLFWDCFPDFPPLFLGLYSSLMFIV